ncbi:hypothetical protein Tco_0754839 [Tanacetum coccineum]
MWTYLKNMEGYKLKDLKSKGFDSIKEMFDRAFKRVNTFEDFRTELVEDEEEIYMLVEKKYPLTPPTLLMMLEKKLQIDYESEMVYQLFNGRIVGIKSHLDAVWITTAHVYVNAAQLELVLLKDFKENILSSYYCWWRSRVASRTSSPTNSTLEIPTAPIPLAPSTVVAPSTDIISLGFDREEIGHSSSDHSSSGHSISGHSLSGHSPPVTTIADSSAPSRFVYQPLSRTLRYSEAYRHWRSALLSTMYPPMTSESSVGDSSSKLSVRPSRKRCRSPTTTVTLYIYASRALVPSRADLLPPRKRFRDSISLEDSVEDDIDTDVLADIEADATAIGAAADMDVKAKDDEGIGMEVDVGVDVEDEVEGKVESSDRGTMEIPLQRVEYIETGLRKLEVESLIVGGERASLLDQIMTITFSDMTPEAINKLINQRVADALAAYEANHAAELAVESQSQNGDDDDNGNIGGNGNRNGRGNRDGNGGGNGNRNRGGNRNGNPNRNDRGAMPVVQRYQVKYVTCTLLNNALTWWNAHKRTVGSDAAFAMTWRELIKLMTEVEKFNGGIPDNIQGNVIAEPTRQQDVVRIANNLMDQKLKGYVVKNAKNKRRFDNNQKDKCVQQPSYKRQNVGGQSVARAYTAGNNEKRGYAGPLPYYNKWKLHHEGPCTVKCEKCNKVMHTTRDCINVVAATAT